MMNPFWQKLHCPPCLWRALLVGSLGSILLFWCLDLLFPFRFKIDYAQRVLSAEGQPLSAYLSSDDKWQLKTHLSDLSPELKTAFLEKEDKYFYYHLGVNPFSVARAVFNNVRSGKTTSGASTITMQVVRLLYPQERTYVNKLVEMFRGLQLEWHFSKEEIFEMYVNLVPYGGNIEGVEAASRLYFGTSPAKLSLAQAVTLAIVPNRPTSLALGKNNTAIIEARNAWLRRFEKEGIFSKEAVEDALDEPLEAYRRTAPRIAPHFSRWISAQNPQSPIVQTTIRQETQQKAEKLTQDYARRTARFNVHHAAVVVVDNRKREVVAYVGSPDFDDPNAGQVDGVRAVRSPGSTLKPFVYGLAFDRGLYTPKRVIADLPTDIEGYSPQNFDREYHGKVTIETALSHSLNVPAVRVLDQVGVPDFIHLLSNAGFRQIEKDKNYLGLSLALGGCGVSLYELAGAYCALANQGKYLPLKFQKEENLKLDTVTLLRPETAFMLTEILTQLERPDFPNNYRNNPNVPRIAWKTGTSYGRRDAWSIGLNKNYTVAVWTGNFGGEGVRELTGADMATPLLFRIFQEIDRTKPEYWNQMPQGLKFRLVCEESGQVPEDFCEHQLLDYFIPLVSDTRPCTHQRRFFVNAAETMSYCGNCLPANGYKRKLYPNESSEVIAFYQQKSVPFQLPPPHNPNCQRVASDNPPNIISPVANREYLRDSPETELMLQCQTASGVGHVYWYINDRFYSKVEAGQHLFFRPSPGEVKISCGDDRGRSSDIYIRVK